MIKEKTYKIKIKTKINHDSMWLKVVTEPKLYAKFKISRNAIKFSYVGGKKELKVANILKKEFKRLNSLNFSYSDMFMEIELNGNKLFS